MPVDASLDTVQGIYLAVFGRPADPAGLVFWTRNLKLALSNRRAFEGFFRSDAFVESIEDVAAESLPARWYQHLTGTAPPPEMLVEIGSVRTARLAQLYDQVHHVIATARQQHPDHMAQLLLQAHRFSWSVYRAGIRLDNDMVEPIRVSFADARFIAAGQTGVDGLLSQWDIKEAPAYGVALSRRLTSTLHEPASEESTLVQALYLALLQRPADPEGHKFWVERLRRWGDELRLVDAFLNAWELEGVAGEDACLDVVAQRLTGQTLTRTDGSSRAQYTFSQRLLALIDQCRDKFPEAYLRRVEQAWRFTQRCIEEDRCFSESNLQTIEAALRSPSWLQQPERSLDQLLQKLPKREAKVAEREFERQLISSLDPQVLPEASNGEGPKLILHIGAEKTGSSSIQAFLFENRERLREQGFEYLFSDGRIEQRELALYCVDSFMGDDHAANLHISGEFLRSNWKDRFEREFGRKVRQACDRGHTVILSSEHLQSRLKSPGNIGVLRQLLTPYFSEIRVLVYLRRQDQLATSLYSTKCRNGWLGGGVFPPNIHAKTPYYNYQLLLQRWASGFGHAALIPRLFNKSRLRNQNPVDDFCALTGIDSQCGDLEPVSARNTALPASAMYAVEILNRRYPQFEARPADPELRAIRMRIIARVSADFPGAARKPLRADAESFYRMFADSNRALLAEWPQIDDSFSLDFSMYPTRREIPAFSGLELDAIVDELVSASGRKDINSVDLPRPTIPLSRAERLKALFQWRRYRDRVSA